MQTSAALSGLTGPELIENPTFPLRWSTGTSIATGDGRRYFRRRGRCAVDEAGSGVGRPDPFLDHPHHLDDPGRVAHARTYLVAG
jgi:hypothetical protein